MRKAVRAIVIKDGNLLVMHRNKFGKEYDTLPGGNIEMGETAEQALFRELTEETMITVSDPVFTYLEEAGDPYGTQYIYVCNYVSGEPQLSPGSEEEMIHKLGQNLYNPQWVALSELPALPFMSEKLKEAILKGAQEGFPTEPQQIR